MTTKISVVLPNFNGRDLLESYLPFTFKALQNTGLFFEIILVDDCSTDDSIKWVKENFPSIEIIQNQTNRGFGYSCNQGIRKATGELVFLLNSDIQLTPEYFLHQLKYFELEDTFGVMGQILKSKNSELEIGAKIPRRRGLMLKADFQYLPEKSAVNPPTLFLSGANALIDRKKLLTLGGFDEVYSPYYSEDLDLSIRAWKMGWKCYFEPSSLCFHLGSSSIKSSSSKSKIKEIYFRNRMVFHAIHLESHQLGLWKLQIFFFDVLPKLLLGKIWIVKSYQGLNRLWPEILQSRNNLYGLRTKERSIKSLREVEKEIISLIPPTSYLTGVKP
ncbi:glycosyltransferase family 2 protein [Algoriphagus confluentis]|uniref:Glycosyltransferase 2-like domain-containing protein n=1 Tax=Algoriphagus confluentis TaxID=1697556 RepID=A0ABQ6PUC4_9BACT|nr:hypothetical protein Aconfl_41990 [Algoriphagus confluentis]